MRLRRDEIMKVCEEMEMETIQRDELSGVLGSDSSYRVDYETFKRMLGLGTSARGERSNKGKAVSSATPSHPFCSHFCMLPGLPVVRLHDGTLLGS